LKSNVVVEAIGSRKVSIDQILHRQKTDPTLELAQPHNAGSAAFSSRTASFSGRGLGLAASPPSPLSGKSRLVRSS
jgi:hypothetical protein